MRWQVKFDLFSNQIPLVSIINSKKSILYLRGQYTAQNVYFKQGGVVGGELSDFGVSPKTLFISAGIDWMMSDTSASQSARLSNRGVKRKRLEISRGCSAVNPCRQCYTLLTPPSRSLSRTRVRAHTPSEMDARHTHTPPPAKSLWACWCVQRSSEQAPA